MSDSAFVSHCLELLSPLGRTSSRRMFGGRALYIDDLCMALVFQDALYLKVDDTQRAAFENAGCKPFTYSPAGTDEIHSLRYYTAPEEAMESPAEMTPWARRALAAAVAARAIAPRAKKKAAVAGKKPSATKVAAEKVAPKAAARKAAARKPATP